MSYLKVANLTFDEKKLKVNYRVASNNLRPVLYESGSIQCDTREGFNEKISSFFSDLIGREIQFNKSCKSKAHYAFLKVEELLKDKYDMSSTDLWTSRLSKASEEEILEVAKIRSEMEKYFRDQLKEKIPKDMYYMHKENKYLMSSVSPNGAWWSGLYPEKKFDAVQALYYKIHHGFTMTKVDTEEK